MPHSLPLESSSLHHHCQVTEAAVLHLHLILVMNTGGEKQRNNIILFLACSLDGKNGFTQMCHNIVKTEE